MPKAKKFGAFAGVFTPSILTILGVIMYMRLGWVVGQAGLFNAVIIILLAHVISISTGLSVSSIATDKKIKAGGIYYILSRSLGLPMGGSIGITLFIGTALSISLYLVGFAENFLSIEPVRVFLGLEENRFGYQVVGTGAIIVLVLIAFISTSLAIKTQYYILAAIALSLVSIFAGFFFYPDFRPEAVITDTAPEGIPLELLFAVFFPAVTGFTAGVAMSGDLKDPKRAIPVGTMSAIITGLVIYLGLAIAIAFFVNRDLLLNDINYLMKVAWFSPLVVAGIWGATLSSALGGILGGPRILQAMSADRIGPRVFSRGYGVNNEPRNALILIFLIAEAGILIGELNVIAGIVSMFYLASYGFINIAYYLESWASADFRPSFKINRYIGLIGFIAAFGVMFQLDMLSMFAALIIMIGIYFFLKRKQLKLDFGDVWQSVWSSLMRTALEKMDNADEVERNWQPNIILFSGGTKKRPHLLSLGKCLVGRHGVLSNFDLIENKGARVLFPKKNQSLPGEESAKGVFTRRQTVKDVYEGIEMISRTYGFSGLEPNTVMLGWARQTRDPVRFGQLLKTLYDLDLNVLMLGYDKRVGFGKKQTIDIWFKDRSNHGNLALTLSKLLVLSDDWQNAHVRVLIVNYRNEKSESIYRKMEGILDNMRIDAKVKVINNQIERKPFYDIVEVESALTDLVFLEIPRIKEKMENEFVESTGRLLDKIGTVMLIEASSSFKKLKIGIEEQEIPEFTRELQKTLKDADLPSRVIPHKPELDVELSGMSETLQQLMNDYHTRTFLPLLNFRTEKTDLVKQAVEKSFGVIAEKGDKLGPRERLQLTSQLKSGLFVRIAKIIDEQIRRIPAEKEENLEQGTDFFLKSIREIVRRIPEKITIRYYDADFAHEENDPLRVRSYKNRKRLFNRKKLKSGGISYPVKFNSHCRVVFPLQSLVSAENAFTAFGQYNITYVLELQKLLYAISDAFSFLENNADKNNFKKLSRDGKQNVDIHLQRLSVLNQDMITKLPVSLLTETQQSLNSIGEEINRVPANFFLRPIPKKKIAEGLRNLPTLPEKWASNHNTLLKTLHIESQLLLAEHRINRTVSEAMNEIQRILQDQVFMKIDQVRKSIESPAEGPEKQTSKVPVLLSLAANPLQLSLNKVIDKAFRNIKSTLRQMPESVEIFPEDTINEITNIQFEEQERIKIPVLRLVDYYLQNELIAPLVSSTNQFVKEVHSALTRIEDAARLIALSLQADPEKPHATEYDSFGDVSGFISEQQDRIEKNATGVRQEFESYQRQIRNNLSKIGHELHLYRLSRAAENSALFMRKEAKKGMRFLRNNLARTKAFIQKQRANIWYSQSRARLLARKISDGRNEHDTVINRVLNLKDSLAVNQTQLDKLPFYYQQLFLSKYNFQSEFWFGRSKEITEAKKAIKRYQAGHKGTLVITGDRISGKSFFANFIASEALKGHTVYTISPPGAGSTNPEPFRKTLEEALDRSGSMDEMLESLPEQTVLILDDLELWWEKAPSGSKLLGKLFELVEKHCEKILFILVSNKRAFRIMNQIMPFDDFALLTVDLPPFSSRDLQEIILFRHKTSGFNLSVDSTIPSGLTQARLARLFNKVFTVSGGNVGAALLCWVANIREFKNDTIYMQSPRSPETDVLKGLSGDLKVYLMQFVLHKRLSIEKLTRIMHENEDKIRYILQLLKRSGLITEQAEKVFEIDRYMYIHVSKFLFEQYDKND